MAEERRITLGLKACLKCKFLVEDKETICPNCGNNTFTKNWSGVIILYKPDQSTLAQILNIKKPGRYAIKVKGVV